MATKTISCAFSCIEAFIQTLLKAVRTMTNVVLKKEYKKQYTSAVSTRVSNALLVGEIIGQIVIGLTCDYLGRKVAIITTTAMIVLGGILATASHGITIDGMFWMMTISRGIVGFGTGGEVCKHRPFLESFFKHSVLSLQVVSSFLHIGFGSSERVYIEESRANFYYGDQFPTFVRWPVGSDCLLDCVFRCDWQTSFNCLASYFRHWLPLATNRLLFPRQDVKFEALPPRSNQEEGAVPLGDKVLLEIFDRNVWSLVSL